MGVWGRTALLAEGQPPPLPNCVLSDTSTLATPDWSELRKAVSSTYRSSPTPLKLLKSLRLGREL